MPITKGCQQIVNEANARIRTLSIDEAKARPGDPDVVFVDSRDDCDVRDVRELEREGMVPGAQHAPRGMIEFWVDPASPYYKEVFGSGKEFVFYCASAWRSGLATAAVPDMAMERVCHLEGRFSAWKKAGGAIAQRPAKAH